MMSSNRNRLENNTEHWNALLLSLRELIEWVIRKDTELTGLGPIRGDLSTLVKQQVRAYHVSLIIKTQSINKLDKLYTPPLRLNSLLSSFPLSQG